MVEQMTANSGGKKLTSKETARILGVSQASVKRWADGGLLPTIKTAGGHRRFMPEDVAFFQRSGFSKQTIVEETRADAPIAPQIGTLKADHAALIDEMFDVMVEGTSDDVSAFLLNLYLQEQSVSRIVDYVLCPALRKIGDYWLQGKLSVAQEHVASRTGLAALQRLRTVLRAELVRGRRAICCSTENDFHEFPIQIASLTLENKGWEVINLGASTPFYALDEAVERFRPRLVCVASTILSDLDRAVREFKDFRRTAERLNVSIVLGGEGFSRKVRSRFDAHLHAEGFEQLESFAASLTN
jgi:excisionase family DNA binding protein